MLATFVRPIAATIRPPAGATFLAFASPRTNSLYLSYMDRTGTVRAFVHASW
jgi:hypothetical protein